MRNRRIQSMRNRKQFISLLLMLALLLGMVPGTLASALADSIEIEGDLPEALPAQTDQGSLDLEQIEPDTQERANDIENRPWGFADEFYSGLASPSQEIVDSLNGKNWMSGISGEYCLNDFNIPYTHDSAMTDYIYHWTSSAGSCTTGFSPARPSPWATPGRSAIIWNAAESRNSMLSPGDFPFPHPILKKQKAFPCTNKRRGAPHRGASALVFKSGTGATSFRDTLFRCLRSTGRACPCCLSGCI